MAKGGRSTPKAYVIQYKAIERKATQCDVMVRKMNTMTQCKARRELTKVLEEPENAGEYDAVIAKWPDGDTWACSGCTVGELRRELQNGPGEFWSGQHKISKAMLRIVRDRKSVV